MAVVCLLTVAAAGQDAPPPGCAPEKPAGYQLPLPLATQSAQCLPARTLDLSAHTDVEKTHPMRFHSPEGHLLRLPVIAARYWVAETLEIRFDGAGQIWAFKKDGGFQSEIGDFSLWTKWIFAPETIRRPGFGLIWGLKLPNASDETDLGTDQADIYMHAAAGRRVGPRARVDANVGIGIRGDPTQTAYQSDILVAGLSGSMDLGRGVTGAADFSGTTGKGYLPALSILRAGAVWRSPWHGLRFFAFLGKGLTTSSPDWALRARASVALWGVGR